MIGPKEFIRLDRGDVICLPDDERWTVYLAVTDRHSVKHVFVQREDDNGVTERFRWMDGLVPKSQDPTLTDRFNDPATTVDWFGPNRP